MAARPTLKVMELVHVDDFAADEIGRHAAPDPRSAGFSQQVA